MRLTHRLRLALAAALGSGSLIAVVLTLAVWTIYHSEQLEADSTLTAAARLAQNEIEGGREPKYDSIAEVYPKVSLAVFDTAGEARIRIGDLAIVPIQGSGFARFSSVLVRFHSERTRTGALVVTATDWSDRRADLTRLSIVMAVLWAVLVAVIAVVAWSAARATFLPLEELSRQAQLLSGSDLSRRLESPDLAEFGTFASRLNGFLEKIEKAMKREEQFAADAAHELRTPLTVIQGQLETALMRDRTPEEYRQAIERTLSEVERLNSLVGTLLQSARAQLHNSRPVEILPLMHGVHDRWTDQFDARQVQLQVECADVTALTVEEELVSVVDNFLSNALRHSPPGSSVSLVVRPVGKDVEISVTDQGPGVPAAAREQVFERLARLDTARNRAAGGSGIGLAVCKRLVEQRGGAIWVEEAPGGGARFVARLPRAVPPRQA